MAEREKITQAHRFGAWAGAWLRRWRALEGRQLERAQASGMRHGRLLVRCAFRGGDLLILASLLLGGYAVVLPILLTVGVLYLASRAPEVDLGATPMRPHPNADEIYHIDHPAYWPDLYDESGTLK
jgi:endonuclease YncB( thermonuclease family)